MVASFLAAMPTWRNFDPMPILASDEKEKRAKAIADDDRQMPDDDRQMPDDRDDEIDKLFDR
jgi:hypothetical protein